MPWKYFKTPPRELKKLFKSEETRFFIAVGLKVSAISLVITCFVHYLLYLVIRMNYGFFKAQNFSGLTEESDFSSFVASGALENAPIVFAFHIFLFFIGVYVGWLMLRPFRVMGEYCEKVLDNPNTVYHVDEFSNYRLLTRFSEFFFEYLREARLKKQLYAHSIPPQFSRIHSPVLDWVFLLHFGILLVIIAISSAVFIIENSTEIFQSMIELAEKSIRGPVSSKYFAHQMFIMDEVVTITITSIVVAYSLLGLHLYSKVAGAAFGIFSTMRSFMKGSCFSRVHLVGYSYIREHTRKLNKYLDYIENTFDKAKPKG